MTAVQSPTGASSAPSAPRPGPAAPVTPGASWLRRLDTPGAVALLVLLLGGLFVVARWHVAADGDVSRFVVPGSGYVTEEAEIDPEPGTGYDGQFAYRLALDPTDLGLRENGVVLDSPLRLQRIAYPALAHVVALGRPGWVPGALVLVNLVGLALLALVSSLLARDLGRRPVAGLLVVGFFGFVTTLSRDLTEIWTATLLLSALLAWRRDRAGLAAALATGAVLSRETALLLYAALVVAEGVRARSASARALLLASLPALAFLTWQLVCRAAVGELPLLSSSGKNLVVPATDLVPAALDWVRGAADLQRADLIHLGQLLTLGVVVGSAAAGLRTTQATVGERAAWVLSLLLVLSLSANVWKGPADFRTSAELHVLSAVLLLGSTRSLVLPAAALAVATTMTALLRVTSI